MRNLLLPVLMLSSGCATLDDASTYTGSARQNRVYLSGDELISFDRSEDRDRYTCRDGWLVCEEWGRTMNCGCQAPWR